MREYFRQEVSNGVKEAASVKEAAAKAAPITSKVA
jgi:hypothetical protein